MIAQKSPPKTQGAWPGCQAPTEFEFENGIPAYLEMGRKDPVWLLRELFGSKLWAMQQTICYLIRDFHRVSVRSCHGSGKSYLAAGVTLWFLLMFFPSIVLTTAPTWRQVEKIIWKEIRAAIHRSPYDLDFMKLMPRSPQIEIDGEEWFALGMATNQPDKFQGFHSEHILVIVDEPPGVDEDIFEGIEGVLAAGEYRYFHIGNPTKIGGTFYNAHTKRESGWKTVHISAFDTPNFTEFGLTVEDFINDTWEAKITGPLPAPYLIRPAWVAEKYRSWGTDHPAFQSRVLGQFPKGGDNNVIPLNWIELAVERYKELLDSEEGLPKKGRVILGVDVARSGRDDSVITARQGQVQIDQRTFHGLDTQEVAGEAIRAYRELDAYQMNVDVIGIGAGVCDEVKLHRGINMVEVNVSQASDVKDQNGARVFENRRAELWWALREAFDPKGLEPLAIIDDEDLQGDLAAPLYNFKKGWTQIEPKEETKKRLKRSPDKGDALMLTYYPEIDPRVKIPTDFGEPDNIDWADVTSSEDNENEGLDGNDY